MKLATVSSLYVVAAHVLIKADPLGNFSPLHGGYCSWSDCNGRVEGGDFCNINPQNCVSCGAEWCNSTILPPKGFYCNWNDCNGQREGGEFCNESKERCLSCGVGAQWCNMNDTPVVSLTSVTNSTPPRSNSTTPSSSQPRANPLVATPFSNELPSNATPHGVPPLQASDSMSYDGYCSWVGCYGIGQGGEYCSTRDTCLSCGAGAQWCTETIPPSDSAYCNWNDCNGQREGGDYCNESQDRCLSCGAQWCATPEGNFSASVAARPSNHPVEPRVNASGSASTDAGYCTWIGCYGIPQGGEYCSTEDACLSCGEGAQWCNVTLPSPNNTYCNWNGCNGRQEGGDYCNRSEERCLACGAGAQWCEGNDPIVKTNASDPFRAANSSGALPEANISGPVHEGTANLTEEAIVQPTNEALDPTSPPSQAPLASPSIQDEPMSEGYCSWVGCFGNAQGGTGCNQSPESCLSCGAGAQWCDHTLPISGTAYCNWSQCNGFKQGGQWCNGSKERCLSCGSGAEWCGATELAPSSSPMLPVEKDETYLIPDNAVWGTPSELLQEVSPALQSDGKASCALATMLMVACLVGVTALLL